MTPPRRKPADPLDRFHEPVREWFRASFPAPTEAQRRGWPPIQGGESTLLLAPTGSGKTLAAFLAALDRVVFSPAPPVKERCRVLYVSPLKALAVDVERNLRAPLEGIVAAAARLGVAATTPVVGVRSGDTPANERARMGRRPPDVLITTPESLFLLLTASSREILASVDVVIVDEVHSLVGTKRGAHLALSLERLEWLRPKERPPLQRIGLSATMRPAEEGARWLGGGAVGGGRNPRWTPRPVHVVDAGSRKALDLRVEVPVEDMTPVAPAPGDDRKAAASRSIWPSIHPRLVELIRAHRSTMIFVNSRRLAERLAAALNETAGEEVALAHHGSLAKDARRAIEERLKEGALPAIVATSSLELGIDMGAVDLVVQVEAPPSIASGLQRVGRGGHAVGAVSRGVLFPKYRGDLLACAAATPMLRAGEVEETRVPRNPLDVLAQQVVAIAAVGTTDVEDLFRLVRAAAPFGDIARGSFEGVLDMLSGRWASDEFAELRPRLTWDRTKGTLRARPGARHVAVVNAGTIPDRGLYGVFLSHGPEGASRRVGELDEEMVFESRVGEVFLLGASSWRIDEITHDRVLVSPAPGEPGKMPFWHGDRPGRAAAFGEAIGRLSRELLAAPRDVAEQRLHDEHGLDPLATRNLLAYLDDQSAATGEVPTDRTIVVERHRDDLGDWRVCVLSVAGARVHAPWAMAAVLQWQERGVEDVDVLWSDDGMVFRFPDTEAPPDLAPLFPAADAVEDLVTRALGGTSLFAARFRENAARALLLPRRHPGRRSPLWAQRKRAADLLRVAAKHGSFPILLETYRECLRDVFDLPRVAETLRRIETKRLRVVRVDLRSPSPFASSLLFTYVANYIYDGDAPLAERRAHALSVDMTQLAELLGEADLRELLDVEAIRRVEASLQRLDGRHPVRDVDGVHDLLLSLGDLATGEIRARSVPEADVGAWTEALAAEGRIHAAAVAGQERWVAAEDAGRLRDALGVAPPPDVPEAFLEPVDDATADLVSRYARTHGPFRPDEVSGRLGLALDEARRTLRRLAEAGRVVEGEFLPGGHGREVCDADVLRRVKRMSLAKLREEIEPVEPPALARFLVEWHGLDGPRSGGNALLDVVRLLQGAPLPASVLESDVLPARLRDYEPSHLDALCAAGEVVWTGLEPIGANDGRVALWLREDFALLAPPAVPADGEMAAKVRDALGRRGAMFFADLKAETGAFAGDLVEALWALVWAGEATNDTLAPLRSYVRGAGADGRRDPSRPRSAPGREGRWSLVPRRSSPDSRATETRRRAALADALLSRHGLVARETLAAEAVPGGFAAVYPVLRAMEDAGRVRRGWFVAGLGATQFARPGVEERLRALRDAPEGPPVGVLLAATDPANPYGAVLPWPPSDGARFQRAAGSRVVLVDGELAGYLPRGGGELTTLLPEDEPRRTRRARSLADALARVADRSPRGVLLLERIDGGPPEASPLAPLLRETGFTPGARGLLRAHPE